MRNDILKRIIVPVANTEDAEATAAALVPYVEPGTGTIIAVHVIEKAGGAPDKASVEQRELRAQEIFETVTEGLADTETELQTKLLYGTDIAEAILRAAHESEASAIAFTPRGSGRWVKLLSGDVMTDLLTKSDLPVVSLPKPEERAEAT